MAHDCPDCDEQCYCGGDVDDINFGYFSGCNHCLDGDMKDSDDWDEFYDEPETVVPPKEPAK